MATSLQKRRAKEMGLPIPGQQQITISEADTMEVRCKDCDGDLFDIVYRKRTLPKISIKNPTGKDMPIKIEVFVCRACGSESNQG